MHGMCSELLQVPLLLGAKVGGQLHARLPGIESIKDGLVSDGLEEPRWNWQERPEDGLEAVGVHEVMDDAECGWRGECEGENGELDKRLAGKVRLSRRDRWEMRAVGCEDESVNGEYHALL
jgi:hypothetical protein